MGQMGVYLLLITVELKILKINKHKQFISFCLQPDEADYDEIPIEQYGMAMLRGMGWKDGEGIGKHKKFVNIYLSM